MFLKSIFINKYLFYGDTTVYDRWQWISKRLPRNRDKWKLLDVGCGSGAYTLKAASKGYQSRGLSWSEEDMIKATKRAKLSRYENCKFDVFDVRNLIEYQYEEFDVIINSENIEHLIDDLSLFKAMYSKLKKGGYLLLTTPNYFYRPISDEDIGPFPLPNKLGSHVRRGYTKTMLEELCSESGFKVQEISSCSGFLSQKITFLIRFLNEIVGFRFSWLITLPLRILPIIFDPIIKKLLNFEELSICLLAYKPRFSE